tara:strand:- start:1380 stop:2018 length:639 start_codon:yes stop_codon:yes gene_type:complete
MSNQFRKFTLQYAYLQLEKDEVFDICEKAEPQIREGMKKFYPEHFKRFFGPPEEIVSKEKKEEDVGHGTQKEDMISDSDEQPESKILNEEHHTIKTPPKNKDLKILYRKIAEKTHPDKIGNNSQAHIFSEASSAYSSNNIARLLELAGQLNIEILKLSDESILLLKNNIKKISEQINTKKGSTAWAWHMAGDSDERKKQIIQFILQQRGIAL